MSRPDEAILTAYLDGELAGPEREWVEAQLAASTELQNSLAQLRQEIEQVNQALALFAPPLGGRPAPWPALQQPDRSPRPRNSAPPRPEPDRRIWETRPVLSQLKASVQTLQWGRLLFQLAGVTTVLFLILFIGASLARQGLSGLDEQLTQPEGQATRPGRILFTASTNGTARSIYTINPDGTALTFIRELDSESGPPRLAPDGSQIVFPDAADIYLANRNGAVLANLTNSPAQGESFPAWSPDGAWIAFAGAEGLNLVQRDGANLARLTDQPANYSYPVWSPDGQWLAFISDRTGWWDLYVVRSDGSELRHLTQNLVTEMYPTWAPDGQRIAFTGEAGISIINIDGTGRLDLPYNNPDYLLPRQLAWAPDGQRIAFVASRASPAISQQVQTFFTIQPDGSNLTRLTGEETWVGAWFAWSPDGQWLVYSVGVLDDSRLYRMKADGAQPTRLTDDSIKGIDYIEWVASP